MSSSHLGSDNEGGGRLAMSLPPCEISKLDDIVDLLQVFTFISKCIIKLYLLKISNDWSYDYGLNICVVFVL